jgi:hypothetical protein
MLAELRMTMDEPPYFNELCRQVGCVVLQAQLIESTLAAYLATSLRLKESEAMTQVQAALESANRQTIGTLVQNIRKQFPLPPDIDDRIWKLKEERNWLIHRLHRENESAMYLPDQAEQVFRRIESIACEINSVMTELDTIGDSLMTKHGFDLLEVRKLAEERLASHKSNRHSNSGQ